MTVKQKIQLQKVLTEAHYNHAKELKARAFFKVGDRAVSEDLVQETFLKTWTYLVKGGKIETMKAFLYHVLNNLVVDKYRKHKTTSLDALLEKGFEPSVDDSRRLFDILDGKEAFLLIERLPKTYKKIINMRYVKDFSLKEMSATTGVSKNTIAVQAHRGLEKLRMLYSPA